MCIQIISPIITVKLAIIAPLRLIVTLIPIEIDSHAYTNFLNKNFRIVLTTGQVYSVTVFLNKLEATNNVSIITSSATMIHDDGTVLILVFGQGIDSNNKT